MLPLWLTSPAAAEKHHCLSPVTVACVWCRYGPPPVPNPYSMQGGPQGAQGAMSETGGGLRRRYPVAPPAMGGPQQGMMMMQVRQEHGLEGGGGGVGDVLPLDQESGQPLTGGQLRIH
jgi:hypothetical protein